MVHPHACGERTGAAGVEEARGLNLPRPPELTYALASSNAPATAPRLAVPGQDGDLFAVI